jgi:hypothetical protein
MTEAVAKGITVLSGAAAVETDRRATFMQQFTESPIPDSELLQNLGLYINRPALSRVLFMHELYQKIVDVHGVIMEFGVRWGQNMALFSNFRGIYEPYNYNRKIIGFDTFSGFPDIDSKDGAEVAAGDYGVTEDYEDYLELLLDYHESESPIAHKTKYQLIKGDATRTFSEYLKSHPETIVAFAYFDFDIYQPTRHCLELLLPRLTKGSVLAFDELNCPEFPGETLALMEIVGLSAYAIKRSPLNPLISYMTID